MAKLNVSPTKSNLLALRRQLAFVEEGYELLDQKRQILVAELMSRLKRARETEGQVDDLLRRAFATLQEATLDVGSDGLGRAADGVRIEHLLSWSDRHVMGMRLPGVEIRVDPVDAPLALSTTSMNADLALIRFVELLPALAGLAELQHAVHRLARELRKTQRRCNALSKIFIPAYRETISYIVGTLEEREREAFVILKMIRDRLTPSPEGRTS